MSLFANNDTLKSSAVHIQRTVLAYALRSPAYADTLLAKADASCFSEDFTRNVFIALQELTKSGIACSPHLVQQSIQARNPGPHYYTVFDLIKEHDFLSHDFEDILGVMLETRTRGLVQKRAYEILANISDVSRDFSTSMIELRELSDTPVATAGVQTKTPEQIFEEYNSEDVHQGKILSGNPFWDDYYFARGGSRRGQVEFIIAHPKHGKTNFAAYRAVEYAKQGYHIAWFQLEDTALSTADLIRQNAGDDYAAIQDRFHITDRVTYVEDILDECRLLKNKGMLDVLVVDYIGNVEARGVKPNETRQLISTVSKKLTRATISMDCYGMFLSQLRRPDENTKGWNLFPRYQDMKESSQLEADAFVVTGVFRPSQEPSLVYNDQVKWFDHKDILPNLRPKTTIAVKCLANRRQPLDHKVIEMQHHVGGYLKLLTEKPIWP